MNNNTIELRAAAARLLYNNNRDSRDYDMLIEYIDNSAPVVCGHWILLDGGRATCSCCKFTFPDVYDYDNANAFCRKCGAKMDKETEND